ncbi:hypothetical protein DFA_04181 [Cavenderia fasciculata]|uniref:Ankyrin repeat-containing protein n=1 Tax=Cavenderia fasciculata TaxID=261658 RepID=F4Q1I4_CACFS|nr:uncharacterized protein DFA_04181 [Cavenderia fasciculata]EGG18685.1 hypothetical protein DFA_04181 [Cavenderia fasciculata]|eukprot:XP_004366589.1 hypothetical protein DFA_04181 [Cavenderia fasciculata]
MAFQPLKKIKSNHHDDDNTIITTTTTTSTTSMQVDSNNSIDSPLLLLPFPLPTRPSLSIVLKGKYIREKIFGYVKEINEMNKIDDECQSTKGKDIIKLDHLKMISTFAMPWNFIKHYLPKKDSVMESISKVINRYCCHRNATMETFLHLLDWSPEDFKPRNKIVPLVAGLGHTEIFKYLINNYYPRQINIESISESAQTASSNGHLLIVQLVSAMEGVLFSTDAMDLAAYNGHLNTVRYLHENRTEGATTNAMDSAARNGHLNILDWLHFNRSEGATTDAMDMAAENGHLNILEWLHTNQSTIGCTSDAMDRAKSLEIIQFLHRAGKTCTTAAIDNACSNGDLDIVQFLFENRTEGYTQQAVINACKSGNFDLIKYIISNRNEKCTTQEVDTVIGNNCSLDIIKLLDQECTIEGLKYAFENDRLDIVEYLYQKYPTSTRMWTGEAFDEAARHGKLDFIKTLHKNKTKIKVTTNAMDNAAANGHIDVVKFLHDYRTEGCSADAMYKAEENGHIEIVNFLHFNRTEGYTSDDNREEQENNLDCEDWEILDLLIDPNYYGTNN